MNSLPVGVGNSAPAYYLGRPASFWSTAMRARRAPTTSQHLHRAMDVAEEEKEEERADPLEGYDSVSAATVPWTLQEQFAPPMDSGRNALTSAEARS